MRVHLATVGQRHSIPRRWLERAALAAMRATRCPPDAEIEVALVGEARMARLNRRYLRHRGSTDVLTFPGAPGDRVLGEIVISLPRARAQAQQYGQSVRREVALLLIHGVLHLRGYDDGSPAAAARMQARAEAILDRLRPSGPAGRRG